MFLKSGLVPMSTSTVIDLNNLYDVRQVDERTIDYVLSNYDKINTPVSYEQIIPQVAIKPLGVLGVFGVQAVISSIVLFRRFSDTIRYIATTESVMNNQRFVIAKKVVDFLTTNFKKELIILPDEVTSSNFASILKRFSTIFQSYSMHVSGMPSDLLSLISLVSLGQKWIFNVNKKKFMIL